MSLLYLQKALPTLRTAMMHGQVKIEGVKPPGHPTVTVPRKNDSLKTQPVMIRTNAGMIKP